MPDGPTSKGAKPIHEVSAGSGHSVLLKTDGQAVAFGRGVCGQCDIPAAEPGVSYRLSQPLQARYAMALQLSIEMDSLPVAICRSLAGSPLATWKVRPDDCKSYVMRRILQESDVVRTSGSLQGETSSPGFM